MDMERINVAYLTGRGNFWIAWIDDQPVGHVGAQDYGDFIELRRMYVRKEFRRLGIGSALVQALIDHCRKLGAIKSACEQIRMDRGNFSMRNWVSSGLNRREKNSPSSDAWKVRCVCVWSCKNFIFLQVPPHIP